MLRPQRLQPVERKCELDIEGHFGPECTVVVEDCEAFRPWREVGLSAVVTALTNWVMACLVLASLLNPMDESGHMDAMGLAWAGMMAEGDRPFILQKAGGLQGTFSYIRLRAQPRSRGLHRHQSIRLRRRDGHGRGCQSPDRDARAR